MKTDVLKNNRIAMNPHLNQNKKQRLTPGYILINVIFILITISCVLPVILLISVSFSTERDIYRNGYSLIPENFTLAAYNSIFVSSRLLVDAYLVTIVVTAIGSLVGMWLITTLAYVITRKDFKYRNAVSFYVFFTMLFNGGLVPFYILVSQWLGLKNSIFALIVPGLMNAWFVIIMKGFLVNIPDSVIESAKIDGAKEITIFTRIIIPMSKPALATVTLFMVLNYWNDWFLAMLFIENQRLYPLQYMLMKILRSMEFLKSEVAAKYAQQSLAELPTLSARMAMCILAAGPMLFVFPFFQKYFVRGLTVGSVKG